jgi:hypothetical protein
VISETKLAFSALATNVSTEGVIAGSNTIDYNAAAGQGLIVRGVLNVTAGTGTTAVVIRVRKGNQITGALVGLAQTVTLAAGSSATIPYEVLDNAPITAGVDPQGAQSVGQNMYSVTIQQTGGTGAGTVNYGTIGMQSAARTV